MYIKLFINLAVIMISERLLNPPIEKQFGNGLLGFFVEFGILVVISCISYVIMNQVEQRIKQKKVTG